MRKSENFNGKCDAEVHSMLQYPLIRSFFDFSIESEKVNEGDNEGSEDEIIDEEVDRRKRRNFRLSRSSRSGE